MDPYLFRLMWITDDSVYTIIYFQIGKGRKTALNSSLVKQKKKRKRRGDPEAVINLTNLTITVLTALLFIFKGQKN